MNSYLLRNNAHNLVGISPLNEGALCIEPEKKDIFFIYNPSNMKFVYKLKRTSPEKIHMSPGYGFLEPQEIAQITIKANSDAKKPQSVDHFSVMLFPVADQGLLEAKDFWKKVAVAARISKKQFPIKVNNENVPRANSRLSCRATVPLSKISSRKSDQNWEDDKTSCEEDVSDSIKIKSKKSQLEIIESNGEANSDNEETQSAIDDNKSDDEKSEISETSDTSVNSRSVKEKTDENECKEDEQSDYENSTKSSKTASTCLKEATEQSSMFSSEEEPKEISSMKIEVTT